MSAQHSAVVSCTSHCIIGLSCCQKYTAKQEFPSRASLSFLREAMPGKMGNQSMIKVNLSYPLMQCSRNKVAAEPEGALGAHSTTHTPEAVNCA